jgi:hypothetical protein
MFSMSLRQALKQLAALLPLLSIVAVTLRTYGSHWN